MSSCCPKDTTEPLFKGESPSETAVRLLILQLSYRVVHPLSFFRFSLSVVQTTVPYLALVLSPTGVADEITHSVQQI